MAARLPTALHDVMAHYVWESSLKGMYVPEIVRAIAQKFDRVVDEKTVDRMLAEGRAFYLETSEEDKLNARADYVTSQRSYEKEVWRRIRAGGLKPNEVAVLLRVGQTSSTNIAKAFDVLREHVDITTEGQKITREYVGVNMDLV